MVNGPPKHLHWTQRIALAQHNLHAAPRTNNYAFFSTLQAHYYLDGHDPVAALNATLGDDADRLFTVLDNLSSGIAWAYEDAFKSVYDSLRVFAASPSVGTDSRDHLYVLRARLQSDAAQQRIIADNATDKMMSNAITLIQQQPLCAQDDAAHVLCLGTSFIVDAIQVCLAELETLETCISTSSHTYDRGESWSRADNAYAAVCFSVSSATCALKGILNMMESHDDPAGEAASQALHSQESLNLTRRNRGNTGSTESSVSGHSIQGWNVFRRMSTAISGTAPPSRKSSVASIAPAALANLTNSSSTFEVNPRKNSVASIAPNAPTSDPSQVNFTSSTDTRTTPPLKSPPFHRKRPISNSVGTVLSPIPPTPVAENLFNPFDASFTATNTSLANDNEAAFESNADSAPMTPLSPSTSVSTATGGCVGARPSPTPHQRHRSQTKSLSNDALIRSASGNSMTIGISASTILDASPGDMGPGPGSSQQTISSPPLTKPRGSFGRRRSTTVMGQPPTPEELFRVLPVEKAVV